MENIGGILSSLDPWWLIFASILLLLLDWALLESEVFLIIALATFKFSLSLFFGTPEQYLPWLIPVFLGTSFFMQRTIFRNLISSKHPDEMSSIVGETGEISIVTNQNESAGYFFNDNSTAEPHTIDEKRSVRVILRSGRTYPVKNFEGLASGDTVRVTTEESGVVTVKKRKW